MVGIYDTGSGQKKNSYLGREGKEDINRLASLHECTLTTDQVQEFQ